MNITPTQLLRVLLLMLLSALLGCSTGYPYRKSPGPWKPGYVEEITARNGHIFWIVRYVHPEGGKQNGARAFALIRLRASELATERGYKYVRFLDKKTYGAWHTIGGGGYQGTIHGTIDRQGNFSGSGTLSERPPMHINVDWGHDRYGINEMLYVEFKNEVDCITDRCGSVSRDFCIGESCLPDGRYLSRRGRDLVGVWYSAQDIRSEYGRWLANLDK